MARLLQNSFFFFFYLVELVQKEKAHPERLLVQYIVYYSLYPFSVSVTNCCKMHCVCPQADTLQHLLPPPTQFI